MIGKLERVIKKKRKLTKISSISVVKVKTVFFALDLDEENKTFIDLLHPKLANKFFFRTSFQIHIETGNIYYNNLNTNEPFTVFFKNNRTRQKKIINTTLSFTDFFSNYIREFLDDLYFGTSDRFDMLANKNVKYLFYRYNDFFLLKKLTNNIFKALKIN